MQAASRPCVLAALIVLASTGAAAANGPCQVEPDRDVRVIFEGIVMTEETCAQPLYHAFIVEMDLDHEGYTFLVTPYEERLSRTSDFASLHGALVAINGGFWGSSWGGFTMSDGKPWPVESADDETSTVVWFGRRSKKGRIKAGIRPAGEVLTEPLPGMREALFSNAVLVEKGKSVKHDIDGPVFKNRNPRTAVGLTKDRSRLIIVVVDGRQDDWSQGMKLPQLSELLRSHGAWRAANLDGGSSTTLVVPSLGGIVNRPSFKKAPERVVPNHLGILRSKKQLQNAPVSRILAPLSILAGRLKARLTALL